LKLAAVSFSGLLAGGPLARIPQPPSELPVFEFAEFEPTHSVVVDEDEALRERAKDLCEARRHLLEAKDVPLGDFKVVSGSLLVGVLDLPGGGNTNLNEAVAPTKPVIAEDEELTGGELVECKLEAFAVRFFDVDREHLPAG
jgi:hypothetical protein